MVSLWAVVRVRGLANATALDSIDGRQPAQSAPSPHLAGLFPGVLEWTHPVSTAHLWKKDPGKLHTCH